MKQGRKILRGVLVWGSGCAGEFDLLKEPEQRPREPGELPEIFGSEKGRQFDVDDHLIVGRWLKGKSGVAVIFEDEVKFGFAEPVETDRLKMVADMLMFEDIANGFHHVEIYRDGFFAVCETVLGKGVLIRVSAAVVGLAKGPNDPGIRGEDDEEVHVFG